MSGPIAAPARIVCRGTVHVALPPDRALPLFTPRGERAWAEGWAPVFPAEDADDTAPGTVFVTDGHDGGQAIWVVAHRAERTMRYARVIPGRWAGAVEVRCEPAGARTAAEVIYDLTALDPAQCYRLQEFAAGYAAFLGKWEQEIAAALGRPC
jgi:hypothetical protein